MKPNDKQAKYLEAIIMNLQEMMYSSEFDSEEKQDQYIESMAEEVDTELNPDSDAWSYGSIDIASAFQKLYRKILEIK